MSQAYDDFLERMRSFDDEIELEDNELQHAGVKGMKWGVRKAKQHIDSIKRERSWGKMDTDKMLTKDIKKQAQRAQLENDFKRLSKKRGVGNRKESADYLNRANMSDQELTRKVGRLRAKEQLNKGINESTKAQREIAKKVITFATPLVIGAVLNKGTGGFKKDLEGVLMNPNGAKAQAVNTVKKMIIKKVLHGDEDETLLHNLNIDIDEHMDEIIHELIHSDDIDTSILDDYEQELDDDELQHAGVKGMKWGVRKARDNFKKKDAAKRKRVDDYHEKHKDGFVYKKIYARKSKRFKTEGRAKLATQRDYAAMKLVAANVGLTVAKLGLTVGVAAATSPAGRRFAKNVVQKAKGSPVRYVSGKMMKNVVRG